MDINDFLKNGVSVPNPNYRKPTKKDPIGSPKFIRSDNYEDALDRGDRIGQHLAKYSYDLTHLNTGNEKWDEYGVHINPVNTEEELKKERANNQSALEQAGNSLVQAVGNEIVLGTFLGLSNLVDAAINFNAEKGEDDYTNPVSTYLEGLQNEIRNRFEIYEEDPNATWAIGDFGWWTNNAVSIASTASMLIPSTLTVKGLGLLGKVANIGTKSSILAARAAKALTRSTKSTARLAKSIGVGTEIGTTALFSRTMENYLEARGVYNEVKDNTLNTIKSMSAEDKQKMIERNPQLADKTDEEMAAYIAGASADETFRNDYAMLLMDIIQFKAISSLWKGVKNKTATAALRQENKKAINSLVGETTENATKNVSKNSWLKDRLDGIKEAIKHPLTTAGAVQWSEGIEEGYQGIQTEKGKEVAEMILNPEFTPRSIESYLTDDSIWEQAFWGVIGGMGFQAAGKALGNLYRKGESYYKYKRGKLSEEDFASNMTAEEKIRSLEIKGRSERNYNFIQKMKLLNDLKNPDEYKTDPITGERIKEDGVELYKSLTPEEAEIKKAQLTNDYISSMAMDAIDAGNYDLFKEYVTSQEFDKHFKDAGLEFNTNDKNFSQQLIERAEDIANNYETNLYNILKNTEVDNDSVAKIAAREITREQLAVDELTERKELLEDKINKINTSDSTILDNYRRKAITDYVKKQLALIDKREQAMYEDYRNHNITEQAKQQYEKDYNLRRKSLVKFLNDNNPFTGDISEQIKSLYDKIGINDQSLLSEINKTMSNIEDIINDEEEGTLPKAVSELVDKQISVEDALSHQEFILPKNQENYVERVNDISQQVDLFTRNKLNNAAKKVENYIIQQEDLQKAFEDVMSGNVESLKNELDILKIGYYTTDGYTKSIIATIREEQNKRKKKEQAEKEVVVDGNKSSEKRTTAVKEGVKAVNDAAEENSKAEEGEQTDSSTGGQTQTSEQTGPTQTAPVQQTPPPKNEDKDKNDAEKGTITKEEIEGFDSAAAKDAAKVAEAFNISIDEGAVGRASTIAFSIFRESRNIFDDALGKDINSEEAQRLINMIIEELENQGVSVGFAPAAAKRGLRLALNVISRKLASRKDSNADKFKNLADTIASKQDMTQDMSAITKSLNDTELNEVIDKLLETYSSYKEIATPKGQKVIINLEKLFNDIVYNKEIGIDIDTAMHILYNMRDYITNPNNTKYIFTHKRSLNSILKNPAEFFNSIVNERLEEVQLDNYMHISPSNKRDNEYSRIIAGLNGGESIEVEYNPDRNGNIHSISFKVNGKEIGFISTVTPNDTNTGYTSFISKYSGGINYNVINNDGVYSSNTDELFESIFNAEDILWNIINKQHRYNINNRNERVSDEEYTSFINHPVVKKAIENGIIILPKKWDERSRKVVDKFVTDRQKAQFIISNLENVVFFNPYAQSMIEYYSSYQKWIKNVFTNYKNTHKIQTALNTNKKITVKYAGLANTYKNQTSDIKSIIDEEEHGIADIGLTFDRNPIVGVVNTNGNTMLINEGTGETIVSSTPFSIGSMGMFIGGRDNTPILAMFTSANKLGDKIKKQLKDELTDIFTGFQEKRYTYEEVDKKLSSLFNGPGINNPTIFQGYSVIHDGNNLALSIGGQLKKYVLVINKFKKGTTELGTGISYAPNGELKKSRSSISVNKKFIDNIVNEIAENLVYNKTFYTLNNIGEDNTSDNPYMYKENGKFVIELGGVKTVYDNFGDFVLQENAFNTNQGRNEYGGYFDNTDKVNSLYIDVSVFETSDSKQHPVEGQYQSVGDTIRTASTTKFNSSKELLEKAAIDKKDIDFLTGDNEYKIPIIPEVYGYDNKLTHEYAVFRKGRILFSNAGATYANKSPFNLKRLLIHENLHDKFNKQNLFERQGLVEELLDTYNATIEAVNNIIETANEDSAKYKNAVKVRNWIEENKFNPINYFTQFTAEKNAQYASMSEEERERIFAEEWLVETLTQPLLMNFLNNTEYRDKEIIVEGIDNENKNIWQKIIDLLLKLFGKGNTNIKNNTIFAQQYLILSNITTPTNNTNEQTISEETDDIETDESEDTESIKETDDISEEDIDGELGVDEDEESEEDINDDKIIDDNDNIELPAITTSAEEYTTEEQNILNNAPRNSQGKLLAPNGEPSNLTERQYIQVRTKAFKNWFGEWENNPNEASKVIDENGEPLVVYHGGSSAKIFNTKGGQFGAGIKKGDIGTYFTTSKSNAKFYEEIYTFKSEEKWIELADLVRKGLLNDEDKKKMDEAWEIEKPSTRAFFLNIRNPKITNYEGTRKKGYTKKDSNIGDNDGQHIIISDANYSEYVIFNPNQIKSATDNVGTYDTNNPDIRYATTSNTLDYIIDHVANDGGTTAETFGVTRITNMANYLNMFAEQDKLLIAKMLDNGEIKYACR